LLAPGNSSRRIALIGGIATTQWRNKKGPPEGDPL
jgi:hypothetical protein